MTPAALAPNFRWRLLPETPRRRDRLCRELRLGPVTAQILVNRSHADPARAAQLLQPDLRTLPDPSRLPDIEAALAALRELVEDHRAGRPHPVLIHGDYDVDGTCGAVLLYRLLQMLGVEAKVFLPDRVRDGYSFGENSLQAVRDHQARLVIAVDNGTTAVEPLRRLAADGVRVLVVDHHLAGDELPPCTALLNPWLAQDREEPLFPHFCGAGVAYLLAWGLLRDLHGDGTLPESHRRFLYDALGFVAIATLADSMRLEGPNRGLVRRGLETLPGSSFAGLRALVEELRLGHPSASDVAYRIAPHLNAAGRMGCPELSFRLLATSDPNEAQALAKKLREWNRARQDLQASEQLALESQVEEQRERGDRVLFAGRSEAAFGVLGIVAARFHETTGLPCLLWSECSPGVARGSARGPEGVNLVELMRGADEHFLGYGGHAQAAGFHFHPDLAEVLGERLRDSATRLPEPQPPTVQVDMEVQPHDLTLAAVEEFNLLEPFGQAFGQPLFLASAMTLLAPPHFMGESGRHVSLQVEKNGHAVRALGWSMAERLQELQQGAQVDLVFEAGINAFRGRRSVEWTIRDVRRSGTLEAMAVTAPSP